MFAKAGFDRMDRDCQDKEERMKEEGMNDE
jgi:hypothetical protein